jgi:hypothetical protein
VQRFLAIGVPKNKKTKIFFKKKFFKNEKK